jgi:hypothetical protein
MQKSIGREAAIKMAQSGWWKDLSPRQICKVQLFIKECCMPFREFTTALNEALGRPVYTHELADIQSIQLEYLGEKDAPTMEEIVGMLPAEKVIILGEEVKR